MNFNPAKWRDWQLQMEEFDGSSITVPLPYDVPEGPEAGNTLVSTNTIQFVAGASAVDNYYVGFDVILEKVLPNGKTHTQKKRIVSYDGTTKIAIIDGVWDTDYEPEAGDNYTLVLSYPDARVTINPVMQTFDYICSVRYGRGLDPEKDFFLDSVLTTARKCDAKSDVSLKLTADTTVYKDAVYKYEYNSKLLWEGKVREDSSGKYVAFTNVLGKITNKWFSWKPYKAGEYIYTSDNMYRVTTDTTIPTKPVHTSGSVGNVEFIGSITVTLVSGTGPATLTLDITTNPVLALNAEGVEVSGYTLYDADSISYWRRMGWDQHSQNSATLYQTNFTIDTSTPLFDNVNMMLGHYLGIIRYSEGKYVFDLEEAQSEYIPVGEADIVGKIVLDDKGSGKASNSLSVSYYDPGNNYESKNITLFSKKFLEQDRKVPKKGNLTISGITNYYNVRLLASTYLQKSRMANSIRMTLMPEFMSLVPGSVIGITYDRFKWDNKPFRVDTLTIEENNLITITADEYDDSFYVLTNLTKVQGVGNRAPISYTPLDAPTNLTATNTVNNNEIKDGILLTWKNPVRMSPATGIEIYSSDTNKSELVGTSISSNSITFSESHGLSVGSSIRATTSGNGIESGNTYYVTSVDSATAVTLSTEYGGLPTTLTNGASLNIKFSPFKLVGSLTYPETEFLHTFPNITEQTTKYYKVRYKVTK